MNKISYTDALLELGAKIDALTDCVGRQEEILLAVSKINGHVREHGEALAANQQWIKGHKKEHQVLDSRVQTLGNRVWVLSGGTGLLAIVASVLQFLNL